ncbi:MAG TPA: NAD(P)-dependent alcohol dehydrogenase [Candidatus Limnocylindrales bacterium]|nr:NAD(P)-dependent alcohol dehydrogenase [Candidatus Limnocylindrales bacterium]
MKIAMRDRWGGPEVMTIREVETPVPTGDQVLVRVHASSVNRADLDWMLPKGGWVARLFLGLRRPRRHTLGIDMAGTVEALGPGATRFQPGDRVFGDLFFQGMAAFAEFVCVRERALQLIPDGLPFEEAATLPHSALLAVMGLKPYWGQELRAGGSVMVVGASGNVGPFEVQIAKARGLRVTGVCRTAKMDFVRSLGADEVIDYTTTDYTKSGPYDRIIDVDAHRSIFGYRKALKPGGVYISMGGNATWILSYLAAGLTFGLARGGRHMGLMPGWRPFHPDDVAILRELIAHGAIKPRIDRRYPLSEVAQALWHVHEGRNQGKVVITL